MGELGWGSLSEVPSHHLRERGGYLDWLSEE